MEVLELAVVVCRLEPDVIVLEVDGPVDESVGEATVVVDGAELEVVGQVDVQVGEIDEAPVVASVDELVVDDVEKIVIQSRLA